MRCLHYYLYISSYLHTLSPSLYLILHHRFFFLYNTHHPNSPNHQHQQPTQPHRSSIYTIETESVTSCTLLTESIICVYILNQMNSIIKKSIKILITKIPIINE